jgi:hypothetical protein
MLETAIMMLRIIRSWPSLERAYRRRISLDPIKYHSRHCCAPSIMSVAPELKRAVNPSLEPGSDEEVKSLLSTLYSTFRVRNFHG